MGSAIARFWRSTSANWRDSLANCHTNAVGDRPVSSNEGFGFPLPHFVTRASLDYKAKSFQFAHNIPELRKAAGALDEVDFSAHVYPVFALAGRL